MPEDRNHIMEMTSQIVSSYVSNNTVPVDELPGFIHKIYRTMSTIDEKGVVVQDRPQPAVPIKKSIQPDYIICLEDGKKLKMLKRHLKTAYNLSPEEYRDRWGLPNDYPMVAPNYAKRRSRLAKDIGLGIKGRSL